MLSQHISDAMSSVKDIDTQARADRIFKNASTLYAQDHPLDMKQASKNFGITLMVFLKTVPAWVYILIVSVVVIVLLFVFAPEKKLCDAFTPDTYLRLEDDVDDDNNDNVRPR